MNILKSRCDFRFLCFWQIPACLSYFLVLFSTTVDSNAQSNLSKSESQFKTSILTAPKIQPAKNPDIKILDFALFSQWPYQTGKENNSAKMTGLGNFTIYNTDQGLPLSAVACSIKDRYGNLWFGTYGGGVCRYDGNSFLTFTTANGMPNNNIICILEDSSGNLWFGTSGGGVAMFNGRYIKTFTTRDGLSNNIISSLCEDGKGNILIGTAMNGLNRYDGKSFQVISNSDNRDERTISGIVKNKSGNLWIGVNPGGINLFNGKSFKKYNIENGLADNSVLCIFSDSRDNLWAGHVNGKISRYDGKKFTVFTVKDGVPGSDISCIFEDKSGNMWFGTQGNGICSFNGKEFIAYSTDQGLSNNNVTSISTDNAGDLWICTNGGGISRFDGKAFIRYTSSQGLSNSCVWSCFEDVSGNLWFGTFQNGLSGFNRKKFISFSGKNSLVKKDIGSISDDHKGSAWLGTFGDGIYRIEGNVMKNYNLKHGLPNNFIRSLLHDSKGNFWIGTNGSGLVRFNGKKFEIYSTEQGLSGNYLLTVIEDHSGNIWLGTDGDGLMKLQKNMEGRYNITYYTVEDGLAHNSVHCILHASDGTFWIGTAGGISHFDGQSFTNYRTQNGLSDNFITQAIQDKAGRIFFGTNRGISVIKEFKGKLPVFENYSKLTGFPVEDINLGQNSLLLDSEGIIWAGTGADETALVRFDYSEVIKNMKPLTIVIHDIKINEEKISWYSLSDKYGSNPDSLARYEESGLGAQLTEFERNDLKINYRDVKFTDIKPFYPIPENLILPYKHNHITFEFSAIEPAKLYLVKYQYFLEGYDQSWSPVTNKTSAVYGNISEGTYTFILRAQSHEGIWSKPLKYTFKVLPPWYRTFWAYVIYFVLSIAILYVGLKKYTARLLREKNQLEELVKKRTEEIQNQVVILNQEIEIRKIAEALLLEREAELKELNHTKDKLFSVIAHDLRSPFSGILGLLQMLQNSMKDEPVEKSQELLVHVFSATKSAYNLLETLLDWVKSQSQQVKINKEKIDLFNVINNNIEDFHIISLSKKVTIRVDDSDKIYVLTDENMLNTILRNLISNSVKYCKTGGLINISVLKNAGFVEVSVADNGIGISDEMKKLLFKSGINESVNGTANEKGTGLGLIICKEFLEKLGEKIWVESEPGKGSCFTFSLPFYNDSLFVKNE